jgi:hypothetical protein
MFRNDFESAPISMIITNLAAKAYSGETNLATALENIVARMGNFVQSGRPRVPNPADPREDYADKWSRDARLETNFWNWHAAVRADIAKLPAILQRSTVAKDVRGIFRVDLTQEELSQFEPQSSSRESSASRVAPTLIIPSAPRPWGE